jgi:hypothetical protein
LDNARYRWGEEYGSIDRQNFDAIEVAPRQPVRAPFSLLLPTRSRQKVGDWPTISTNPCHWDHLFIRHLWTEKAMTAPFVSSR